MKKNILPNHIRIYILALIIKDGIMSFTVLKYKHLDISPYFII